MLCSPEFSYMYYACVFDKRALVAGAAVGNEDTVELRVWVDTEVEEDGGG